FVFQPDITGPSQPHNFGLKDKALGTSEGILPAVTVTGIKLMSLNLLTENDTDPVVWRGPVIANAAKQFFTDTLWGEVDYMFVDMPPGTGDVPLTVFQSLPVDGIILVTSPQDLVSMIVEKAAKMAQMMNIPILGIVENMSYFVCPDCKTKHYIYGKSRLDETAQKYGVNTVAHLPLNPETASLLDEGKAERVPTDQLADITEKIFLL
ncbi:MAG: Mrp/NBP35 family ATP-binding protein, partial [Corallococcus sp.]|nr:Mrp/NBP35 family ATP-binding protein [Corallococcus sp.]